MKICIVYLASPRAFREDMFQTLRTTLLKHSLAITRRVLPNTDIYVFHEDYTETEFNELPGVKQFIQVDFSGFEQFRAPGLRRPYGYLMMCRFFSGVMQAHPVLQDYTHYLRLDDDSYLIEPYITESCLNKFENNDYVIRSIFRDDQDQQSLCDFTFQFLEQNGYKNVLPILKKQLYSCNFLKADGLYTGLAPYNNFHIASLRLWKHPLIQSYIRALEECHGILRYGWMDANIHAMIIYVLAPVSNLNIHYEDSFGYRHNQHFSMEKSPYVYYVKDTRFYPEECVESETLASPKEETG
jgi:hypothetical protein